MGFVSRHGFQRSQKNEELRFKEGLKREIKECRIAGTTEQAAEKSGGYRTNRTAGGSRWGSRVFLRLRVSTFPAT